MPLQTSGAISLSNIQSEFGGQNPISISEYYRGGGAVPNSTVNNSIPTSGQISLSNFYGGANFVVDNTFSGTIGAWATGGKYSMNVKGLSNANGYSVSNGAITTNNGTHSTTVVSFESIDGSNFGMTLSMTTNGDGIALWNAGVRGFSATGGLGTHYFQQPTNATSKSLIMPVGVNSANIAVSNWLNSNVGTNITVTLIY